MTKEIEIKGVKTNNLKSIDVHIPYSKITAITGPSGGGKSSLAYQTIHELCSQEFSTLETGHFEIPSYKVESYSGLIPSVAIKQINNNLNPRSTLLSYLNITSIVSLLVGSEACTVPYGYLKINKPSNECPECHGLGYQLGVDYRKIVDPNKKIEDQPFSCWQAGESGRETRLLVEHCKSLGIDSETRFLDLSSEEKDNLLLGVSPNRYRVRFKHSGRYRQRDIEYVGPIVDIERKIKSTKISDRKYAEKYSSKIVCKYCSGSRIDVVKYRGYSIFGLTYDEFLTESIKLLLVKLKECASHFGDSPPLKKIISLFDAIVNVGIGYLSLSRSIPSLSGGELQKLNFSRLANVEISNILVVIDEISSQLHVSDYRKIMDHIFVIRDVGNTIVLVEHCDYFIDRSDGEIYIGPGVGEEGGFLAGRKHVDGDITFSHRKSLEGSISLPSVNKNNVKDVLLSLPKNRLTAICGKSGSGKSSFANGLAEVYKDVELVSQEAIKGNIRSTLATFSELNLCIAGWYSKVLHVDRGIFMPSQGKLGACPKCDGKGLVRFERSFDTSVTIECDLCDGNLFSNIVKEYVVDGVDVSQLYSLPVKKIKQVFSDIPLNVLKPIDTMVNLGLGHLTLNRKTSSLSGGELKRLKLSKYLCRRSSSKILIIDEPGSGLNDETIFKVMNYIRSKTDSYLSIIVIDHKPSVFSRCDHLIEFGPGSGGEGGNIVYSGDPEKYYVEKYLKYLE